MDTYTCKCFIGCPIPSLRRKIICINLIRFFIFRKCFHFKCYVRNQYPFHIRAFPKWTTNCLSELAVGVVYCGHATSRSLVQIHAWSRKICYNNGLSVCWCIWIYVAYCIQIFSFHVYQRTKDKTFLSLIFICNSVHRHVIMCKILY